MFSNNDGVSKTGISRKSNIGNRVQVPYRLKSGEVESQVYSGDSSPVRTGEMELISGRWSVQ